MTALFRIALVSALSSASALVLGSESLAVDAVCWIAVQLTAFVWWARRCERKFQSESDPWQ